VALPMGFHRLREKQESKREEKRRCSKKRDVPSDP